MSSREKDYTLGQIRGTIWAFGTRTKCMAREPLIGQIKSNIVENISKIRSMDLENLLGPMEAPT